MPKTTDQSNVYFNLRDRAEAHLLSGTSPSSGQWSMGVDALRLLHRLSGDPDLAEDALKLLHELQVHQVELDLQNEEIAANERALMEDLSLYRALYEHAPVGYLVVDLEGAVVQANLTGAELFGVAREDMEGERFDTFISPQSRPQFLGLLERVVQSGSKGFCTAESAEGSQGSRRLQVAASLPEGQAHILLACCERQNIE